ncbi:Uncharacterised protein [Brevundimonas vesicularis]|uniref:Uncharacterized protein n=1 Tax=Brevundimonas vesicularis TaxID=41276 RepID=A0A2X1DF09_BREVE|nr:Uncharacterised protein [Brevundimonas vesicularis]
MPTGMVAVLLPLGMVTVPVMGVFLVKSSTLVGALGVMVYLMVTSSAAGLSSVTVYSTVPTPSLTFSRPEMEALGRAGLSSPPPPPPPPPARAASPANGIRANGHRGSAIAAAVATLSADGLGGDNAFRQLVNGGTGLRGFRYVWINSTVLMQSDEEIICFIARGGVIVLNDESGLLSGLSFKGYKKVVAGALDFDVFRGKACDFVD